MTLGLRSSPDHSNTRTQNLHQQPHDTHPISIPNSCSTTRDSSDTSADLSETADKNGSKSDSDNSQPHILNQPKDPNNEGESTPPSCPCDLSQPQTVGQLEKPREENRPTLSNHPSSNSGDQHSSKGEANSDGGSSRNRTSTREEFNKLYNLLCAFGTAPRHPNVVSKHNDVRETIKNSDLSKYYTRNLAIQPLFSLAEQADDWESEHVLPNGFIRRTAGWIRMAKLTYDRLQKACLEYSGEDTG